MDDCMSNRELIINNTINKQVIVSYKKVLPGHVQPKKEIIPKSSTVKIPLPATNALQVDVTGYGKQKVYVDEYKAPVMIRSGDNCIVIMQGERTLGVVRQAQQRR